MEAKTCNDCRWCVKDEGDPPYCLMKDLYTLVSPNDKACEDFVEAKGD